MKRVYRNLLHKQVLTQPYRPFNKRLHNSDESRLHISISKESRAFYKNIITTLDEKDRIVYENQTFIPNALKKNECRRQMIIQKIRCNNCVKLKYLTGLIEDDEIDEIIVSTPLNGCSLLYTDHIGREEIPLLENNSYQIKSKDTDINKIMFLSHSINEVICVELLMRITIESALNKTLTFEQLPQEVFISMRFVYTSLGRSCLAAVSIRAIHGTTLLNTFVCPREQVMNYATIHGGITESMLLGQPDSIDVHESIINILKGKIIIGYQVLKQLERARIDPQLILEIKEIANMRLSFNHIGENQHRTLKEIAEDHQLSDLVKKLMTLLEEIDLIRALYHKIQIKNLEGYSGKPLCLNNNLVEDLKEINLILEDEIVLDDIPDGDI